MGSQALHDPRRRHHWAGVTCVVLGTAVTGAGTAALAWWISRPDDLQVLGLALWPVWLLYGAGLIVCGGFVMRGHEPAVVVALVLAGFGAMSCLPPGTLLALARVPVALLFLLFGLAFGLLVLQLCAALSVHRIVALQVRGFEPVIGAEAGQKRDPRPASEDRQGGDSTLTIQVTTNVHGPMRRVLGMGDAAPGGRGGATR